MEINKNMNQRINERNSNIELLRLILILMVVTEHFISSTYSLEIVKNNSTTNFIFHFLSSLCVCAVNCFMIISGFFLYGNKKIKISKIIDLIIIVVFYRYLNYFCNLLLLKENFSIKELIIVTLPINYFAIFYCIIYFFSPFVSKLYEMLDIRNSSLLTISLVVIFVCIPTILDFGTDLTGIESKVLSPISLLGNGGVHHSSVFC